LTDVGDDGEEEKSERNASTECNNKKGKNTKGEKKR